MGHGSFASSLTTGSSSGKVNVPRVLIESTLEPTDGGARAVRCHFPLSEERPAPEGATTNE